MVVHSTTGLDEVSVQTVDVRTVIQLDVVTGKVDVVGTYVTVVVGVERVRVTVEVVVTVRVEVSVLVVGM